MTSGVSTSNSAEGEPIAHLPPLCKLIDTPALIAEAVAALYQLPASLPPSLYVDLEGVDLCRFGSISVLQIYAVPLKTTYLIDIFVLGQDAFETPSTTSVDKTLRTLLVDPAIPKVFFDCRNDSDALFNLFQLDIGGKGITNTLKGVHDIQLMELAVRKGSKRLVNGLAKTIRDYGGLSEQELERWSQVKDKGKKLFAPEKGGDWSIWEKRPLNNDLVLYATHDVTILPKLWKCFDARLSQKWRSKVDTEVFWRLQLARQEQYYGRNKDSMTLGPW